METVFVEEEPPLLHAYVPPPVAVSVAEVTTQVSVEDAGVTPRVGGVIFWFTTAEAEAVQEGRIVPVTL